MAGKRALEGVDYLLLAGLLTALAVPSRVLLFTVPGLYVAVRHAENDSRARWGLRPGIVALRDMPAGTVLQKDDIAQSLAPNELRGAGIFGPLRYAETLGHTLKEDLRKGDLLREADLVPPS